LSTALHLRTHPPQMTITPLELLSFALTVASAASESQGHLRGGWLRGISRKRDDDRRRLRVCNAFASTAALEMQRVQEPRLVEYPLPFKECRDYTLPLKLGDELLFRASGKDVGTFAVQKLPSAGSLLLLVPHRKRAASEEAVSFMSHMFAPTGSLSQLALIDTVSEGVDQRQKTPSVTLAETSRQQGGWTSERAGEEMGFNEVVSLAPGYYHLALPSAGNSSQVYLNANGQESYVALRVGGSSSYPEELVVFPHVGLAELDASARSAATTGMNLWGVLLVSGVALLKWPEPLLHF